MTTARQIKGFVDKLTRVDQRIFTGGVFEIDVLLYLYDWSGAGNHTAYDGTTEGTAWFTLMRSSDGVAVLERDSATHTQISRVSIGGVPAIRLVLDSSDFASVAAGQYVYDIRSAADTGNRDVYTVLWGLMKVAAEISSA